VSEVLARRALEIDDPANRLPRQFRDVILRRERLLVLEAVRHQEEGVFFRACRMSSSGLKVRMRRWSVMLRPRSGACTGAAGRTRSSLYRPGSHGCIVQDGQSLNVGHLDHLDHLNPRGHLNRCAGYLEYYA
jgi:hypothetical protein